MATSKEQLEKALSSSGLDKLDSKYPDLDRAYKVLNNKLAGYNNLWDYYDGDQPLMYTARRMRDLFRGLDMSTFVENWCAVVIDAANDRINLSSVSVKSSSDNDLLEEAWQSKEVGLEADDVHEAALVVGESYVIVWPDEDEKAEIFYNDPRLVHLFYDPANPKKKRYGAKWWVDSAQHLRITLYYPDRLEYYRSTKLAKNVSSVKAFRPFSPDDSEGGETAENTYAEVPIFHFRIERRKVKGDLANAVPLQNGINKLLTDMMVAAEYGAFSQRYIISHADTASLKNAPGQIWEVPAGDGIGEPTKIGQFEATPLENYIKAIDHLASSMAIIARTPKHFLFQQGGDPSGEALIAMEAPLNKRCNDHIEKFKPVWKEVVVFMLKVMKKDTLKEDVEITFDKPETIQPLAEAKIRTEGKNAGIPLKTMLRDEGKSEAWMEQMEKDKKEEQKESSNNLGAALAKAMRDSNQPGETEEE